MTIPFKKVSLIIKSHLRVKKQAKESSRLAAKARLWFGHNLLYKMMRSGQNSPEVKKENGLGSGEV
jgi:hypothetical protein